MEELTKEQQHFITSLYKEYLVRQPALPAEKARSFASSAFIRENVFPEYDDQKIKSLCDGLKRHGYLSCSYYDNLPFNITVSDKTIAYMEHRFSHGVKSILDFLAKLK